MAQIAAQRQARLYLQRQAAAAAAHLPLNQHSGAN